jgi:hypothetical protein
MQKVAFHILTNIKVDAAGIAVDKTKQTKTIN